MRLAAKYPKSVLMASGQRKFQPGALLIAAFLGLQGLCPGSLMVSSLTMGDGHLVLATDLVVCCVSFFSKSRSVSPLVWPYTSVSMKLRLKLDCTALIGGLAS